MNFRGETCSFRRASISARVLPRRPSFAKWTRRASRARWGAGAPLTDLCEACGLCCDGTFYTYVTTVPDDLPKLRNYPRLVLKIRDDQETFDEPCALHDGKGCTAYQDRPATCSGYFCKVLRAVARDDLTEDEARLLIKEARALVENVREYIAFEPDQPIAVSTWDEPPEGIDEGARLAWERTAYHLGKYFLGTVREEVEVTEPVHRGSASKDFSHPENLKLAKHTFKRQDEFRRFLEDPAVRATKNLAEEERRGAVVIRKGCGCNRPPATAAARFDE